MYQISIVKTVGGEVEQMPLLTMDKRAHAKRVMKEKVEFFRNALDHPTMSMVGASVEVFCERVDGILGDGAEMIMDCVIKRPIDSPAAMVCWRQGGE